MNPSTSLGSRLNAVFDLVAEVQQSNPYPIIWDCCCDHGYLGMKILNENLSEKLVFVDQVSHIIEQLKTRLVSYSSSQYELVTADAGELSFNLQQRHLVIIAGVGGECTVDIISAIKGNHPDVQIDYIFCPSTSQKALREYLIAHKFGMEYENIACENQRYYEILFVKGGVAAGELPDVSRINKMWDENDPGHQQHLSKLARHEHQKSLGAKL
jgi:tRNA (adenine22-N1)-methyltransferase